MALFFLLTHHTESLRRVSSLASHSSHFNRKYVVPLDFHLEETGREGLPFSQRDFIGLASYLSGCLAGLSEYPFPCQSGQFWFSRPVLVFAGVVMRFIPFDRTRELIYAIFCIFIFSGYVMLDTHLISKRLSPDEYVMGAVLLYVEWVLLVLCAVLKQIRWLFWSLASYRFVCRSTLVPDMNIFTNISQVIYVLEALGDKDKKKNASSETAGTG